MKRILISLALAVLVLTSTVSAQLQPFMYWVPPSLCVSSVSANGTGTNGQTTSGASGLPVVQAQTSATGTNTHTYICNISPPVSLVNTSGNRIVVTDAVFTYGVQTSALGTQINTLASGTFNSSTVFSTISYPVAAASEAASVVTPVRADSGTMVITPLVASFNAGTTTAGSFFTITFRPATPISWNVDLKQLLMTVTLQNAATSATVTNSAGVLVHIRSN